MSTSKSLGVHIDRNLSWDCWCHIYEISKKIASGISVIKRIRYFLPFEILLNVYYIDLARAKSEAPINKVMT